MATKTFSVQIAGNNDEQPLESDAAHRSIHGLINYLRGVVSGSKNGNVTLTARNSLVAASATVTCASVQAADTVVVGGVTFTAVNGGTPTSVQFDMSGTDAATATALAAAIAAHATASTFVTAASTASGVATITAINPGTVGNGITLTTSNGTRLAATGSGRLASGAETKFSFAF
jgi:hypothetical protein